MSSLSSYSKQADDDWAPVADIMSGLMILFLFLALSYMLKAQDRASSYVALKSNIHSELQKEFREDFKKWNAELPNGTLTIRFKEPSMLFKTGGIEINEKFQTLLDDFFPRYIKILTKNNIMPSVKELRIEGHTSSYWSADNTQTSSYIGNMELSQYRTLSVAKHIEGQSGEVRRHLNWLKSILTTVGYSYSKPILNKYGREDSRKSRRVEFTLILNSDKQLSAIVEDLKK